VELLLENGAEVNYQNNQGCSALFYAAQQGHIGICRMLSAKGADPTLIAHDPEDNYIFHTALDYIEDYSSLKDIFTIHKKCQSAQVFLPISIRQASLSAQVLNVEIIEEGKQNGVPLKSLTAKISAVPRDYISPMCKALSTELSLRLPRPGSGGASRACEGKVSEGFWNMLYSGQQLARMYSIKLVKPSIAAAQEAFGMLVNIYGSILDSGLKKQISLEKVLTACILRTAEGDDANNSSNLDNHNTSTSIVEECNKLVEMVKERVIALKENVKDKEKKLPETDLLTQALQQLSSSSTNSKKEGKRATGTGSTTLDKQGSIATRDRSVHSAAGAKKESLVVLSLRAAWNVTVCIAPRNALFEGDYGEEVKVKVDYTKAEQKTY
jgi:hypothetical protein